MTDLAKLIADIEGAEEGSRELDARMAYVFGYGELSMRAAFEKHGPEAFRPRWRKNKRGEHEQLKSLYQADRFPGKAYILVGEDGRLENPPHYTTNLQDAVDAMPEGWITVHAGQNPMSKTWFWGLGCNAGLIGHFAHDVQSDHKTKSPALALCAAILRAKEAEKCGSM